ncbi:hypothetical protein L3i22_013960 [Actinoplanes sp. L3-i22]|nr:hypothetical protein L3i22_013960 [Actinoplanes sp. L3-i22]
MRLELVKRPRSGAPGTAVVWFAWCNVRPTCTRLGATPRPHVTVVAPGESVTVRSRRVSAPGATRMRISPPQLRLERMAGAVLLRLCVFDAGAA